MIRGLVALLILAASTIGASAARGTETELAAARTDYEKGSYAVARERAERLLASPGIVAAARADALLLAGRASIQLADFPAALVHLRDAEDQAKRGGLRKANALALIYQGDARERMKEHGQALELYRRGLARLKLPEDAAEARLALQQTGDIHVAAARFDEARTAYEKALAHAEASGDPAAVAQSLDYNGFFNRKLGDADRAIALHERAIERAAGITDPVARRRSLARSWNHLGLSQQVAASLAPVRETAVEWLDRSVESELRALESARETEDRLRQGYVLRALAAILRERAELAPLNAARDLDGSAGHAAEALALAAEMKHAEWEGLALHGLAVAHARLGRMDSATQTLERAIAIWERVGDSFSLAWALRFRALEVHERTGDIAAASSDYTRALDLHERLAAGDDIAAVLTLLGRLAERSGDFTSARQRYLQAIDALEALRGRLTTEENRLAFLARRLEPYEALIRLLLRDPGRTSAEDLSLAFEVSERTRGRTLLELMARATRKLHAGVDATTLARERSLEQRMTVLAQNLSRARTQADAQRLRAALDAVRGEQDAFRAGLAKRYPQYERLKNPQPVPLAELRSRVLQPGELLLEYFVGREESYVFAVSREGVRVGRPLGIGGEKLAAAVRRLREGLEVGASGDLSRLVRFDIALAHELHRILLAPAAAEIAAASRVAIVPHGVLFYLPFELLVTELKPGWDGRGFERFAAASYFVEQAPPVRYALSASLLDPALALRPERKRADAGRVLAFVNPVGREQGRSSRGQPLTAVPLQHAEAEGDRIRKVFGRGADVYAREAATRERFMGQGSRYGRLLVSAHGVFDEDDPMQSGVVMVNEQGMYVLVTAEDLFNMRLGVRLASFAACDIGLGRIRAGEGLLGLTRAAKYAGAENLVVSLWSVDDRSTSDLMATFYEGVRDGDEAMALRTAKLGVLRDAGKSGLPYAHPFFWAAFVLY